MGWAERLNRARGPKEAMMFAPVIRADGSVAYVNPQAIQAFLPGDNLPVDDVTNEQGEVIERGCGLAPDQNPWPTCYIMFTFGTNPMRCRGTADMVLKSWFGDPANQPKRIVVPRVGGIQ